MVGIKEDLALQQGAGEQEQAIADGPQGAAVAMAALAQRGVSLAAGRIALGRDARPMVEGPLQSLVAGQAAWGDASLAAAARHRGDAGQGAQDGVFSALHSLPGRLSRSRYK